MVISSITDSYSINNEGNGFALIVCFSFDESSTMEIKSFSIVYDSS